jgi:hypothetical protein
MKSSSCGLYNYANDNCQHIITHNGIEAVRYAQLNFVEILVPQTKAMIFRNALFEIQFETLQCGQLNRKI